MLCRLTDVLWGPTVFPVEFVVRGYITGSTDTSLWTVYRAGKREYCSNSFPDDLRKNQR